MSTEGILTELNYALTGLVRDHSGRKISPTASVMDTQSVKTSTNVPVATQGTDAAKKIVGRKRGIITIAMIDNLARRLTGETTPTWRDG